MQQIVEIERRAVDLKQEITDYQENRLAKAEDYIADLRTKADKLGSIQLDLKRVLRESHTATLITEKEARNEEILSLDTTTGFDCAEKGLNKNGGKRNLN